PPQFAQGPERKLEARLPLAKADFHRPRARVNKTMSGGTSGSLPGQLNALTAPEQTQEGAAVLIAQNDETLAKFVLAILKDLESSAEREASRSAALLVLRQYNQALQAADAALALKPQMPQALWNRALALRGLQHPRMAAQAFRDVEKLGEPGWAEEAALNAAELESTVQQGFEHWRAMDAAGRALLDGPPVNLPEHFVEVPSARLYFYDAIRAASNPEQALALLDLAAKLDARAGRGSILQNYVRRVATADFTRRAPLARDYAELVKAYSDHSTPSPSTTARRNALSEQWQADFLNRLRSAQESDLLLGTLVLLGKSQEDFALLERAAGEDPWFELLLAQRRAAEVSVHRSGGEAIQALLDAYRQHCQTAGLEYRCILLDIELSGLYLQRHQLTEALQHAERGWTNARSGGEWQLERSLLWQLAQTAKFANVAAHLARARFNEFLAFDPAAPETRRAVNQHLADIAWNELQTEEARQAIDTALATGRPLTVSGAFTLSDLARLMRHTEDETHLLRVRDSASTPDERLLADHALGRFIIESDPARGRQMQENLIASAANATADTPVARRVRTYSFTSLLFEAGKRDAYDEVLDLATRERGSPLPGRCFLFATVDSERTLLLVRGADGRLVGDYDDSRRSQLGAKLDGLVKKESLLAPLRACEQIEALARPPLHGRAGLLPPEFAWSYLTRRSAERVPPKPTIKRHLVVSDVEVADPDAPRLNSWRTDFGPDEIPEILKGNQATPSRVLNAMQHASEIDLVTHGYINSAISSPYLLLAPELSGSELTMSMVRSTQLQGAPFVVLAACTAAHTTYAVHEPLSFPAAFFDQGARGVLAATSDILDVDANEFFNTVRARMRNGTPPAIALRDERQAWLAKGRATSWLESVLLFE
ncbi:CHAT domain-containing protein, partial [Myxococcus sp. AM009]|uniref:CHAT domain-containing protein n=1 Tax=Myxococcus sp. AM009 TaxID=2745137 RepID=UPI0015959F0C